MKIISGNGKKKKGGGGLLQQTHVALSAKPPFPVGEIAV